LKTHEQLDLYGVDGFCGKETLLLMMLLPHLSLLVTDFIWVWQRTAAAAELASGAAHDIAKGRALHLFIPCRMLLVLLFWVVGPPSGLSSEMWKLALSGCWHCTFLAGNAVE